MKPMRLYFLSPLSQAEFYFISTQPPGACILMQPNSWLTLHKLSLQFALLPYVCMLFCFVFLSRRAFQNCLLSCEIMLTEDQLSCHFPSCLV